MAPPKRSQGQVVVELPPPPADKWRWTSLSPVKVKREEEEDDVVLTEQEFAPKKPDGVQVKLEKTADELESKEKKVTIKLLTEHYEGGHNQKTSFTIRGRVLGDRGTTMMCLNRVMNPCSPRIPGEHGLFMNVGFPVDPELEVKTDVKDQKPATATNTAAHPTAPIEDFANEGIEKGVTSDDTKVGKNRREPIYAFLSHIAPSHWRYVGHYQLRPSEPLGLEEWQQQSAEVAHNASYPACADCAQFKAKWAKVMLEHRCYDLARVLWHRKQLRAQLGRDPTKEEIREVIEPLGRPVLTGLTERDTRRAFDNGELRIYIQALCFVEYREEFQKDLIKISANPEPRVKAHAVKKRKREGDDKAPPPKKR
ncbi:hypothetical protein AURDEDRAFT_122045 [Auricularia subglabra TFB-10046 SS5]|nr:hypothetical protein AURDEDRAFT_122045 [Auricularia subglabra TFB-10046 SS5]